MEVENNAITVDATSAKRTESSPFATADKEGESKSCVQVPNDAPQVMPLIEWFEASSVRPDEEEYILWPAKRKSDLNIPRYERSNKRACSTFDRIDEPQRIVSIGKITIISSRVNPMEM